MAYSEQFIDDLLKEDPIAITERATGKGHWSNFDEKDMAAALFVSMLSGKRKENALKSTNDTYFGMSWDYLMEVLKENGFKVGTEWEFIDDQWDNEKSKHEKAGIYYRTDGVVVFAESHSNKKSVNSGKCFYELQRKEEIEKQDFRMLVRTGHSWEDGNKLENEIDIRKGLIHNLKKAEQCGNFLRKWESRDRIWILDYMENKRKIDHDSSHEVWSRQYKEVTESHLSSCPKEMLDIMASIKRLNESE